MKFNVARTAHTAYSTENENDRWDGSQGWLTNGENQGTSRKRKTLRKRSRGSSRSRSGYYAVIRARVTRAPTRRKIYDGIMERHRPLWSHGWRHDEISFVCDSVTIRLRWNRLKSVDSGFFIGEKRWNETRNHNLAHKTMHERVHDRPRDLHVTLNDRSVLVKANFQLPRLRSC